MDLQLSGRIAVVTGASPELDALAGGVVVRVPVDLTSPEAPAHAVATAVDAFGGLDILVNNAGGPPPGVRLPRFSFLAPTDEDWRLMFEFNPVPGRSRNPRRDPADARARRRQPRQGALRGVRAAGDPGEHVVPRAGAR